MAILTDNDRSAIWADLMRKMSDERQPVGITKADLRAAVSAVDQWASDNAASFNIAIPQPARNSLTAAQKAMILMYVAQRRYLAGV